MPPADNDTIVAPATAPGAAAVAIVRLSGPQAWPLASRLFPALLPESRPRMALSGRMQTPEGVTDEALVLPFRGPRSYTGEDVVEFHLHGNHALVSAVMRTLAGWGARLAEPGEFTRRAFLNGKLDLAQAEAVAELIAAKSEQAARGAAARLAGSLSTRYALIREALLELMVHLEATIDFPDEDIETLGYPQLFAETSQLREQIGQLTQTFEQGRIERDGLRVGIAGRPNAGKSSLLNRLLGVERAIVTATPGTTRDYLEESFSLGGATLQLVDTAGLRATADDIEAEGIRRAREKLGEADFILYVVDSTIPYDGDEIAEAEALGGGRVIWVQNKMDMGVVPPSPEGVLVFPISVFTGEGLPALQQFLQDQAGTQDGDVGGRVVSARQQRLLSKVGNSLAMVYDGLVERKPPELIVEDLRQAVFAAGELTGEILNDEVLGQIFSKFCIGK